MSTSVVHPTKATTKRHRAKRPKPQPCWVKGCAICGGEHQYGRCPASRR